MRNWSLSANFSFNRSTTLGITGNYGNAALRLSASRKVLKSLSVVATLTASQYESGTFALFNRTVYSATFGLGWSPGNVPLRVW
jgi:hypothetical protein